MLASHPPPGSLGGVYAFQCAIAPHRLYVTLQTSLEPILGQKSPFQVAGGLEKPFFCPFLRSACSLWGRTAWRQVGGKVAWGPAWAPSRAGPVSSVGWSVGVGLRKGGKGRRSEGRRRGKSECLAGLCSPAGVRGPRPHPQAAVPPKVPPKGPGGLGGSGPRAPVVPERQEEAFRWRLLRPLQGFAEHIHQPQEPSAGGSAGVRRAVGAGDRDLLLCLLSVLSQVETKTEEGGGSLCLCLLSGQLWTLLPAHLLPTRFLTCPEC